MRKHKILDAIQTEIRRWENQYAIHFERSDMKGLSRIKKKLDHLKSEYKRVMEGPDGEYYDIDILYRRKEVRSGRTVNADESNKFNVLRVHRVFEKREEKFHKSTPDTFFSSLLNFCCPICNSALWVTDDHSKSSTYQCVMGHEYDKQQLIIWYSEKILEAIENSLDNSGENPKPLISGNTGNENGPEIAQHADKLKNALSELKRKSA